MAEIITVTIPELPALAVASGLEEIAVWRGARLSRIQQRALRGSKTFTGESDPPAQPSEIMALAPVLGDRWRNKATGDEWRVSSLDPFTWEPDGNVKGDSGSSDTPGPPGPRGEAGASGPPGPSGQDVQKVAATDVPNWRAVYLRRDDTFGLADSDDLALRQTTIGLVATNGAAGEILTARTAGELRGPPHGLPLNVPVYAGPGGALVAEPPDAGWSQIVATTVGLDYMIVALGEASIVGDDDDALILPDGSFAVEAPVGQAANPAAVGKYVSPPGLARALLDMLETVLPSGGAAPAPAGLVLDLGAPALIQPNGHRWDFQRFARWRELLAINAGGDARPAISRFLNAMVPAYFGPGRYMLRSRDFATGDFVQVRSSASVDVLCAGEAQFVVTPETLPFTYAGNVFSLGNVDEGSIKASWSALNNTATWVGGDVVLRDLDFANVSASDRRKVSAFYFLQYMHYEVAKSRVDGGWTAPGRTAVNDPLGRPPTDVAWYPTYSYSNGTGVGDTAIGESGCGSCYIHGNSWIGLGDEGYYGSGRRNRDLVLGANPITITSGQSVAQVRTSVPHLLTSGVGVMFGDATPAVAGIALSGYYVATVVDALTFTVPLAGPATQSGSGGTGARVRVDENDDPLNFASRPQGLRARIIGNEAYRVANMATHKRNGQFVEFASNLAIECGGGWLEGTVGFTDGGSDTDGLSTSKRYSGHDNRYLRMWGPCTVIVGDTEFNIHDEHVTDFGSNLFNDGEGIVGFGTGNNLAAYRFLSAENGKVHDIGIKNKNPRWGAGKYGKKAQGGEIVDDLDKCIVGIYIDTDTLLKRPSRDIDITNVSIENVSWPIRNGNANTKDITFSNVRWTGQSREARMAGEYRFARPTKSLTFRPGIAFTDGGSATVDNASRIYGTYTDKGFEFVGTVILASKTGASGRVVITGDFPANASGRDAPVYVQRSGGTGTGICTGVIAAGDNRILLSLESDGTTVSLTDSGAPAGARFAVQGVIPALMLSS